MACHFAARSQPSRSLTGTGAVPFHPANDRLFLRFKTAEGVLRQVAATMAAVAVCCTFASAANALSCPDATRAAFGNPINVTYYLTASACTTTNPGSGVIVSANIKEASGRVSYLPGSLTVTQNFTQGETGCDVVRQSSGGSSNEAAYRWGPNKTCTTYMRFSNDALLRFTANNDANSAVSLTSVALLPPRFPTTSTLTSSPPSPLIYGQPLTLTLSIAASGGSAAGGIAALYINGQFLLQSTLSGQGRTYQYTTVPAGRITSVSTLVGAKRSCHRKRQTRWSSSIRRTPRSR